MATQQQAKVNITNNTDGDARILLFHTNSSNGTQSGSWNASPGQTVGSLTVLFETGFDTKRIRDFWSVLIHVQGGSTPGFYASTAAFDDPAYSKECQLQDADANQTLTLGVSTTTFNINLKSGGCTGGMTKVAPPSPITNVFVVMLENHSFDNIFAMSGIPGIAAASTSDCNTYNNTSYCVQSSAPVSMPTDPGHEFNDTLEHLAGVGATYQSGGAYPPINNSGFAANYATSTTEGPVPPAQDIGNIMACFATPTQLPVIHAAATNFAICDQWFSSLPGPTWPNRSFVHGATSNGMDDSPANWHIAEWEIPGFGVKYQNGSIYQALAKAGIPYRFYNDASNVLLSLYSDDPQNGSRLGALPMTTALSGVTVLDFHSLEHFASDLQGPYPYAYTFIEPNYGNMENATYTGASSQHPMDDTYGAENLLTHVYSAIRNSPYWNTSLLIILYDEHGGFYDSAKPPAAVAPGDTPPKNYSTHGFTFEQLGVRVPAVIVSPLIPAGTVDHTVYDHTSILATLETLFGLKPLTQRDAHANNILHLLSLAAPRTNAPTSLPAPANLGQSAKPRMTPDQVAASDAQPMPQSGNLVGALGLLKKAEADLSSGIESEIAAIKAKIASIETRGHLKAYASDVMEKVRQAKDAREQAERRKANPEG